MNIWSEWKGETGLGWSGAFVAALAGAILQSQSLIDNPAQWICRDSTDIRTCDNFKAVMALGWCLETILHNGRASGSAVCGSLLSTRLPYIYLASKRTPGLWRIPDSTRYYSPPPKKNFDIADPACYSELMAFDRWIVLSTTRQRLSEDDEKALADQLFSSRDIIIVHSNVPKNTARMAQQELDTSGGWFKSRVYRERYDRIYIALRMLCKFVARTMVRIVNGVADPTFSTRELDGLWNDLCELETRIHGALTSLGFGFAVGDEILGVLRSVFSGTSAEQGIGGKLSGGGGGGNLLVTAQGFPDKMDMLFNAIEHIREQHTARLTGGCWPAARIAALYSAHTDGTEPSGLILEKS